ncbi:MAG TPA: 2Fe-2S iron-sulfur cluster-binding protein, partial [bacterium]|nr:2Fe-2S iron-sulfur cluster-binding protein [bacterium]
MTLHLKIWRQKNMQSAGKMVDYTLDNVSTDMSFLEMLDVLNERIIKNGEDPIEYDNDCREGICGMCSMVINGVAHGPEKGTATCQL